jgi:outer membrane biosynthesis protein TonB
MCARTLFLLAFSLAAAVSSYAMGAPVEQQDHFWERFLEGDVSFPTRPPTPGPQATPDPSPAPMPEPTPSPTTETLAPSPVEADCFGFQLKVTCENRNPGASSTSCDDIPATQCEGLEVCDYNVTFVYEVEAPLGADPLTVVSLTSVIPQAELLLNFTGGQQFDHRNPFLLETNITLDLAMQKNYTVLSSMVVVGSDDSCADTDFFRFTAGRLAAPTQDPTPVPTPQPTINENFCIVEVRDIDIS